MTDNTWPTVDTELIDDVTLYSAKLIIPVTGPVIIDGAVAIHGDRVVHVGKTPLGAGGAEAGNDVSRHHP
mgnify:CR=1 FL=1